MASLPCASFFHFFELLHSSSRAALAHSVIFKTHLILLASGIVLAFTDEWGGMLGVEIVWFLVCLYSVTCVYFNWLYIIFLPMSDIAKSKYMGISQVCNGWSTSTPQAGYGYCTLTPQSGLVMVMGQPTHSGSWVWVSVGVGGSCHLQTHRPSAATHTYPPCGCAEQAFWVWLVWSLLTHHCSCHFEAWPELHSMLQATAKVRIIDPSYSTDICSFELNYSMSVCVFIIATWITNTTTTTHIQIAPTMAITATTNKDNNHDYNINKNEDHHGHCITAMTDDGDGDTTNPKMAITATTNDDDNNYNNYRLQQRLQRQTLVIAIVIQLTPQWPSLQPQMTAMTATKNTMTIATTFTTPTTIITNCGDASHHTITTSTTTNRCRINKRGGAICWTLKGGGWLSQY